MREELVNTFNKYLPYGIIWGTELLFPPEVATALIDDLVKNKVRITGCDLWRYVDPVEHPDWIVEILGAGDLADSIYNAEKGTVEGNAEIMKEFIQHHLPEDAQLVSFIYDVGEIYEYIRSQGH